MPRAIVVGSATASGNWLCNRYLAYREKDYTLGNLKRRFHGIKNNQECKINSRNMTYDGVIFSTSFFVLEVVKDEI